MVMTQEEKIAKAWARAWEMYRNLDTRLWVGEAREDMNGNTYIPVQSQRKDHTEPHRVRATPFGPMCDCEHIAFRGNDTPCVHILHVAIKAYHAKKQGTRATWREFSSMYAIPLTSR